MASGILRHAMLHLGERCTERGLLSHRLQALEASSAEVQLLVQALAVRGEGKGEGKGEGGLGDLQAELQGRIIWRQRYPSTMAPQVLPVGSKMAPPSPPPLDKMPPPQRAVMAAMGAMMGLLHAGTVTGSGEHPAWKGRTCLWGNAASAAAGDYEGR